MGDRPSVVVGGTGKTGRGFIGHLLTECGEHFSLIHSTPALDMMLKPEYEVAFFADAHLEFDGDAIAAPQFKPTKRFQNHLTRKLFTYNSASALIAYAGAWLGYEDYGEATRCQVVDALLDRHYTAYNVALCSIFGYGWEEQRDFAALSKQKFQSRDIADTIARNARSPHIKLSRGGPNHRLRGAECEVQRRYPHLYFDSRMRVAIRKSVGYGLVRHTLGEIRYGHPGGNRRPCPGAPAACRNPAPSADVA